MQQKRLSLSLALSVAPFVALMSCGTQAPTPTPPSQAAALSRIITSTVASNDDSNVTFQLGYTGTHHFYRVYIDSDHKAASGFAYSGVGAELLIENGNLFRYTGSGADWSWALVGGVTYVNQSGLATWTVARAAIGETDPCNAAADLLFDIDDGTAPVLHETLTPAASCAPAKGAGGMSGTGGTPGTGGSVAPTPPPAATGGTTGTGGSAHVTPPPAATGGTTGTGGSPAVTPPPATGGTTGTGGSPAVTPPPAATGGTTGTGGSTPVTPPPATGGTTGTGGSASTPPPATGGSSAAGGHTKVVFVVALENEPAASIYGNASAPYINKTLLTQYAHATAFTDPLPDAIPSEPHYVWMEAGTNAFSDHTFTTDADPDASNSTSSTAHLTTQMMAASPAVSWMGWMEGMSSSSTGACPISSGGNMYAAKHDPFVFFQDIVGRTPSETSSVCVAHHQAYTTSAMAQALSQGKVAQYNFIAPNLCNDMHGDSACPGGSSADVIAAGDTWLSTNLPPLIQYVNANDGVIFVVWDEPEGGSPLIPFVAIGPHIKPGYASSVTVTHSALVKTVEKIFGLPTLSTVSSANDFGDLFQAGYYP